MVMKCEVKKCIRCGKEFSLKYPETNKNNGSKIYYCCPYCGQGDFVCSSDRYDGLSLLIEENPPSKKKINQFISCYNDLVNYFIINSPENFSSGDKQKLISVLISNKQRIELPDDEIYKTLYELLNKIYDAMINVLKERE